MKANAAASFGAKDLNATYIKLNSTPTDRYVNYQSQLNSRHRYQIPLGIEIHRHTLLHLIKTQSD